MPLTIAIIVRFMSKVEVSVPRHADELDELASIVSWAFHDTQEGAQKWLRSSPLADIRLAHTGGRLVGGVATIPMGQWFGERSVPCLGLAGVAVKASARGSGVGLAMVSAVLREARDRGLALSALYPSTQALYRQAGYEVAGMYCRHELQLGECPRFRSELELADAEAADQPAIENLYATLSRERPGYLDRGRYIWGRVREYAGTPTRGVVARSSAGIEGYVFMGQTASGPEQYALRVTDFAAATPRATLRLFDYLAGHRSTAQSARWFGGPADQRQLLLPDKIYKTQLEVYWMLRVIDVVRALELRGYPEVEREVVLAVDDPVLPENSGTYRLRVAAGQGTVERVQTAPAARLDVRALAALYTGFLPPRELVRAGALTVEPGALSTLAVLFGGAMPALADYF